MKKTYGLIGYPVKHSLSPAMHNAAFKAMEMDAEYKLFEVRPENLKDFFSYFREGLSGINITIPHKETSIKYVDALELVAKSIHAINTVSVNGDKLIGHNTDVGGFVKALKEDLKFKPASKRAIVFGAGGAARAVGFGLYFDDIKEIILIDIDTKKAAFLANELKEDGCNAIAVENNQHAIRELVLNSDLLVNATPCGMKENDPELMPSEFLHENLVVFDLIYSPRETRLIKEAKRKNIKAINGLGMLLYQGALSFEIWTKQRAPIEVMKKAIS